MLSRVFAANEIDTPYTDYGYAAPCCYPDYYPYSPYYGYGPYYGPRFGANIYIGPGWHGGGWHGGGGWRR